MYHVCCKETLSTPRWFLEKSGAWPSKTLTLSGILKLLINLTVNITVFILIIMNAINALESNNMMLLNWMICILIPLVTFCGKLITLVKNKKCFFSIINCMESDIFNSHDEKLNQYVRKIHNILKLLSKYFIVAVTILVSMFCILPFVKNSMEILPAPFDTGNYDILYKIAHLLVFLYYSFVSISLDTLNLTLLALGGAELDILKEKLLNVIEDAKAYCCSDIKQRTSTENVIENILRDCVILHELINK